MTQPNWLTPEQLDSWLSFVAVVELLPGALDAQLQADAGISHYEYFLLAQLSEAPDRTLRMTELAGATNATLPRLSHVVKRLEQRGYVERVPCPSDKRATNARLTAEGWEKVVATAPGHVGEVRRRVIDALSPEQLRALGEASAAILATLDPPAGFPTRRAESAAGGSTD
ncbi:DNA-binding MarR family transcriptional regulator [Labedella gwakjiensis]|uniref:MarR family transcriptional regulator n=1 Tax=Labedella gwakjiensis TaxID=390269 RepID=A0A2P8GT09_9MICO|nr:MarR family transcriptional regulator [Labedella gwakjiensis]PSL37097.1 DNA-binding MarR family transcriptional regulator [Labedella gwakjiensis]RUQ82000.1 MarR family transcriptional regulator [Labedella gwakjiensis]